MGKTSQTTPAASKDISGKKGDKSVGSGDAKRVGKKGAKSVGGGGKGVNELSTSPIYPVDIDGLAQQVLGILRGSTLSDAKRVLIVVDTTLPSQAYVGLGTSGLTNPGS